MTLNNEINTLAEKEAKLLNLLRKLDKPAIAFSGGVDSSLLLAACAEAGVTATAVMADTDVVPQFEKLDAQRVAQETGVKLLTLPLDVFGVEEFCSNGKERCYYCKKMIFTAIKKAACDYGCGCLLDGANLDDIGDYRPGMRASKELGVISPLLECGFTKSDVRALAAQYKLSVAHKPAYACLASRIAYGEKITAEKLARVETAENALGKMGFTDLRVRCHGNLARIEINAAQIVKAAECRKQITEAISGAGFRYVTLDLKGFRSGSMNG